MKGYLAIGFNVAIIICMTIAGTLFAIPTAAQEPAKLEPYPLDWTISTLDSPGDVGFLPSMAIDSNGSVHIAYMAIGPPACSNEEYSCLKYVTNSGGSWRSEIIDYSPSVGAHASLVVDDEDTVNIVYQDYVNGTLRYSKGGYGHWSVITLDGVDEFPEETSMAIDRNGAVHICYTTYPSGHVGYITDESGVWSYSEIFLSGLAYDPFIALDMGSHPHIFFWEYYGNMIFHATQNPNGWDVDPLFTTQSSDFVFEPDGTIYILYTKSYLGELDLCTVRGGVWSNQTIGPSGWGRLAIGPDGVLSVASVTGFGGSLSHAVMIDGSWRHQLIEANATVQGLPMPGIDAEGEFHVCYYDGSDANLMYAHLFPLQTGVPCKLVAKVTEKGVSLSWSPPNGMDASSITGYYIYRGTSPDNLALLTSLSNVLTYMDSNFSEDHLYYYRLSAVGPTGEGNWTESVVAMQVAISASNDNTILYTGIGIVAILAVAGAAFVIMRRRK